MESNKAIVIDNGSSTIKAGFAGEEIPKSVYEHQLLSLTLC